MYLINRYESRLIATSSAYIGLHAHYDTLVSLSEPNSASDHWSRAHPTQEVSVSDSPRFAFVWINSLGITDLNME